MDLNETADTVAAQILTGFDTHYRIFRAISAGARDRFEHANWAAVGDAHRVRIQLYDRRVRETVGAVIANCPAAVRDEAVWAAVKLAYHRLLRDHLQPELAESFYNSVACQVLHREYFHNAYLFWRPAVATDYLEGRVPTWRAYYPRQRSWCRVALRLLADLGLRLRFENLRRDARVICQALQALAGEDDLDEQVHVLHSLFYRNKAAYLVGRVIAGTRHHPFVVPLLHNGRHQLYVDAILTEPAHIARVFSFARAYCMVDMEVPSAYVEFLRTVVPSKPDAEIYTLIGLQKQGKTVFYRDLQHHLHNSSDAFVPAPGVRGMVMTVFTLPSFPYVFKIIKDEFTPPKETTCEQVKAQYLRVKMHDRVGRMADSWEYSDVALPLDRFEPALVEHLLSEAADTVSVEGDRLIVRHLYIERRLVPLNLYLQSAQAAAAEQAIRDYGDAIRELAGANIFPGDMLLKNFGVTRLGRVVFYDYDELSALTECNFRRIPPPRTPDDELSAEPWYSVGAHDVFPEEFPVFLFPDPEHRRLFMRHHAELATPEFWQRTQMEIGAGLHHDVFPYPESARISPRREIECLTFGW